MSEQLYKNIEKLLIMERYVDELESTGLTKIKQEVDDCIKRRDKRLSEDKHNLTPIESLMDVILTCVESELERKVYEYGPVLITKNQVKIDKYRVDFVCEFFISKKEYIIECDGHNFHEKTKEQVIYDKQRERFLISKGYKVLRYSGSEILNNFEQIKDELVTFFYEEYMDQEHGKEWREYDNQ